MISEGYKTWAKIMRGKSREIMSGRRKRVWAATTRGWQTCTGSSAVTSRWTGGCQSGSPTDLKGWVGEPDRWVVGHRRTTWFWFQYCGINNHFLSTVAALGLDVLSTAYYLEECSHKHLYDNINMTADWEPLSEQMSTKGRRRKRRRQRCGEC